MPGDYIYGQPPCHVTRMSYNKHKERTQNGNLHIFTDFWRFNLLNKKNSSNFAS